MSRHRGLEICYVQFLKMYITEHACPNDCYWKVYPISRRSLIGDLMGDALVGRYHDVCIYIEPQSKVLSKCDAYKRTLEGGTRY